jgi:predicted nucleic acid-binding protein
MRICIDSCVFINALTGADPNAARLLELVGPDLVVVIPRLVAQEVTRNLQTAEQVQRFYRLFHQRTFAFIVDELAPGALVNEYAGKGLPEKADAFIGAFAEWMHADYLISDNRHFLRDLQATAFRVADPATFIALREADLG